MGDVRFDRGRWGRLIALSREQMGLSQVDLAARSKMTQTLVSRLERGSTDPRVSWAVAIEDGLGLPPLALLAQAIVGVRVDDDQMLAAIERATNLTAQQREVLKDVYDGMLRRNASQQSSPQLDGHQ